MKNLNQTLLERDAALSAQLRVAEQPGLLRSVATFFAHSGDSWFCGVVILLVFFLGDNAWKAKALIFGISMIITAVLVLAIKFTVKRRRPEGEWGNIYRKTDPHSFPSGHATRAFLFAALAVWLGPPWFVILMVIWAPLVGLARIAMGVHFVSDVVAGLFLGIFMGWVNYSLVSAALVYFALI
jgi:membrane-associated phospholipid phosphatase